MLKQQEQEQNDLVKGRAQNILSIWIKDDKKNIKQETEIKYFEEETNIKTAMTKEQMMKWKLSALMMSKREISCCQK